MVCVRTNVATVRVIFKEWIVLSLCIVCINARITDAVTSILTVIVIRAIRESIVRPKWPVNLTVLTKAFVKMIIRAHVSMVSQEK